MKTTTKNTQTMSPQTQNTTAFALDKHVPLPPVRFSGQYKYPFRIMDVGDSFFVPETDTSVDSVRASAADARRKTSHRFAVRREDGGCRVWRIE